MKIILSICFLFSVTVFSPAYSYAKVTPSEVYQQAEQIHKEIVLIMKHFKIPYKKSSQTFQADLQPRHVWQKSYFILVKINVFRNKHDLPRISFGSLEPVMELEPILPFEQTQRILTELAILKKRLGIRQKVTPPKRYNSKRPIDVFNKMHQASLAMDALNQEPINPTYVFAEAMRLYEDISLILNRLRIEDTSFPPAKRTDVTPKDSMKQAWLLIQEIQRIQMEMGIAKVDFRVFNKKENSSPADVFNMVGMCIAELQKVKAELGIKDLTHPAEYFQVKTPSEVHQLLGWLIRRMSLINKVR